MYTRFWGFREKPFQQLPNPEFLFLSATHEEALAHLTYALAEGEGFVMITGEVGTGKSTLCRSFLQKLGTDTACAYIFNPKLDPLQLLKSINSEFGIPADADTSKELIDTLNAFLIEKRSSGHKTVIVIDEAQNLPVDCLEQVRLLSNLETTREKLLHLVLVGQPELADMIDSFALRQLGQRIQLVCHLRPLTFEETVQYIQHRINLVSEKPQTPFEKGALRAIYTFSKGVPRLVNTACDRMLLAAYLKSRTRISAGMAARIIEELTHRGRPQPARFSRARVGMATGGVLLCAALITMIFINGRLPLPFSQDRLETASPAIPPVSYESAQTPAPPEKPSATDTGQPGEAEASETVVAAEEAASPDNAIGLEEWLASIQQTDTRRRALEAVLQLWDLSPHGDLQLQGVDDAAYFDLVAERHGLSVQTVTDSIDTLAALGLPAVIRLRGPEAEHPVYAGLLGKHGDHWFLAIDRGDAVVRTDARMLQSFWDGLALVPWKNYMGYSGVIPGGAPRSAVVLLKQLLWEIGYADLLIDDRYDAPTRHAVQEIQAKKGLVVDGLVGNRTKIVLFSEKDSLPIPQLSQWRPPDDGTD